MSLACCSTLNDLYMEGFITFFYSLQKHNPWFNYPYHIFTWGDLSQKNINRLKSLYKNFIFNTIDNDIYINCKYSEKFRKWNINCNNRFEIFDLIQYDKLVFLDTDMLCLSDIKPLFEYDVDFGACAMPKGTEIDHPAKETSALSFDGGLMLISKKYLNKNTKHRLIEISKQRLWSSDEPILNSYFDSSKVTFMPPEYNLLVPELNEELFASARILQFTGSKKPWFEGSILNKYDEYVKNKLQPNFLFKIHNLYETYYKEAR